MVSLLVSILSSPPQPTCIPTMSSWSRIYRLISAQMLVGRAAAQDEHNSARHTIKCELINISWVSSWKVKRRIQSSVSKSARVSGVLSSGLCGGLNTRLQSPHGFIDPGCPAPAANQSSLPIPVPTPITRPLPAHTNVIQSNQMLLGSRGRISKVNS